MMYRKKILHRKGWGGAGKRGARKSGKRNDMRGRGGRINTSWLIGARRGDIARLNSSPRSEHQKNQKGSTRAGARKRKRYKREGSHLWRLQARAVMRGVNTD